MVPLSCGTARKLEAVAMMTGVVSLFARGGTQQATNESANPFGTVNPGLHPHLNAALREVSPAAIEGDLFERTLRSVLRGLLADRA
jgi:hypothetical protein